MKRLYDFARSIGVTWEFVDQLPDPGDYCHATRHIRIRSGMSPVKTVSVFAHELAHAVFGDEPTMFAYLNARQERRADEWAAHFLIHPEDYRLAEEKYGTHVDWIAQELGVLKKIVIAYERTLHRIGDTLYVNPRMGVGNWDARFEAVA